MAEKVVVKNIAEACEHFAKVCGANKNLYRTICLFIDGLKPVHRRIVYAMSKIEDSNKGRDIMKVGRIVGDTLGKYHPHGDAAITAALVGLAQPWNNNVCVIEGEGNFGGMDGSESGHMRYINAKISDYGYDCFLSELDDIPIDWKEAYTGKGMEPEYFPAKYPHALFNGSMAIGYGLASNIPPYNVTEVLEATIALIKNSDIDVVLYPDSPTGCNIIDNGQFEDISHTGSGSFEMEGCYEIDEQKNVITITALPYQVNAAHIIKHITDKKRRKDYMEISDVKDSTKNSNVNIVIELKSDADPHKFIKKLCKQTAMRRSYPVDIRMIDDYQDFDYNIKSFLLEWIEYRRDAKRAMYNNLYSIAMENKHINDTMLFILNDDNIEKTLKITRKSENKAEMAEKFMKTYGISSLQAKTLSSMQINAFNKSSVRKYKEDNEKYSELIKDYEKYLEDDKEIDKVIIAELKRGIKLWGSPRKSKIISEKEKNYVPKTNHIVAVSEDGYCKKLGDNPDTIGKVGRDNSPITVVSINNREDLLIYLANGRVVKLPVSSMGICNIQDIGVPLSRFGDFDSKVVLIMKQPNKDMMKDDAIKLCFVSKQGYVKKTPLSEFANIKGSTKCMNVDDNDELVNVFLTSEEKNHNIIIYTNKGNGLCIDMTEIASYKKTARGLKAINVSEDEYVIGSDRLSDEKEFVLYVTSKGCVKVTEAKYLPKTSRRAEAINLISLDDNDFLIKIKSVHGNEVYNVMKKRSKPEELKVSDIEVVARASKATKMIKVPTGDRILNLIEIK